MKRIIIVSDFHCGSAVGLTPPGFRGTLPDHPSPSFEKYYHRRESLWNWFAKCLKTAGKFDIALINGDAIDGPGERSGGVEQLTTDRSIQAEMACEIIKMLGAKEIHMTYGTPSHAGKDEDWEYVIAQKVGAQICDHLNITVCGLQISMRHQLGGTNSVASRFTAMSQAQIRQMLWAEHGQQPKANLLIRSHVHVCRHAGEPGGGWALWITPGLQGLGTRYGARVIDSLPVDFGFLTLEVESREDYTVTPILAPMSLQTAKVVVVK